MDDKPLLLQAFLLSVAFCEWIEITKVGNTRATQGVPNYEITLDKPEIYNVTENIGKEEEGVFTTTSQIGDDDSDNETIIIEDFPTQTERTNKEIDENNAESNEEQNGLLTMVKHVQNELLDFKGRSLSAKVDRLKTLRDDILHEIKFRISRLFKPSKKGESESRLYHDDHDENHMDYPSNEGTLMTIGFLTFAVFLIKLVLKLIYAYKMKEQYYYQTTTTTTTAASVFLKKADREIDPESARALRYLDEYSPH